MPKDSRHPWYLLDIGVYLVGLAVLTWLAATATTSISYSVAWLDFMALALGTYRLADIISTEEVTSVLRAPFAGRKRGFRGAMATGIECPSCTGVWAGAILLGLAIAFQPHGLIPAYALAFSACERLVSKVYNYLDKRD